MTIANKLTTIILAIARGELGSKPFHSDWMFDTIQTRGYFNEPVKKKSVKDICSRLAREGYLRRVDNVFFASQIMDLVELVHQLTTALKVHGNVPVYSTSGSDNLFSMITADNKFIEM
jgi:hypothetical protein